MNTNDTPIPSSIPQAEASDPVAGRCAVAPGSAFAPKLDTDQREQANAMIEQIIADPEKFAFEIVSLRSALCEIADDPANAVTYFEDKWRTIARNALGLSSNVQSSATPNHGH